MKAYNIIKIWEGLAVPSLNERVTSGHGSSKHARGTQLTGAVFIFVYRKQHTK